MPSPAQAVAPNRRRTYNRICGRIFLFTLLLSKIWLNLILDIKLVFAAPIPIRSRLKYWLNKYASILSDSRSIRFLGKDFHYDNRLMPALLPDYLFEVRKLNDMINFNSLFGVLDIGANVGQFSYTVKSLFPHLRICALEPNPSVYPILEKNASRFDGWTCRNFGIGEENRWSPLFYVPGKSGQGSLYPGNARQGLLSRNLQEVRIQLRKPDQNMMDVVMVNGRVDLIKIDVEGAEHEVIRALAPIKWKYLYMEVSRNRDGAISSKDVIKTLGASLGGPPVICFKSRPSGPTQTYHLLLKSDH